MRAKKAIKAGEMLTKPHPQKARRPDATLFHMGFVLVSGRANLCRLTSVFPLVLVGRWQRRGAA
jgi:hypothetical protein